MLVDDNEELGTGSELGAVEAQQQVQSSALVNQQALTLIQLRDS